MFLICTFGVLLKQMAQKRCDIQPTRTYQAACPGRSPVGVQKPKSKCINLYKHTHVCPRCVPSQCIVYLAYDLLLLCAAAAAAKLQCRFAAVLPSAGQAGCPDVADHKHTSSHSHPHTHTHPQTHTHPPTNTHTHTHTQNKNPLEAVRYPSGVFSKIQQSPVLKKPFLSQKDGNFYVWVCGVCGCVCLGVGVPTYSCFCYFWNLPKNLEDRSLYLSLTH